MHSNSNIAAVILAAGNSSRMGQPKMFLKINHKTLCEKLVLQYRRAGVKKIAVVISEQSLAPEFNKELNWLGRHAEIILNRFPERGRTNSIISGINFYKNADACFIQNVDNPGLSVQLINNMLAVVKKDGYVVPEIAGQSGHPVLLGKKVFQYIMNLKGYDWILKDELKQFKKNYVLSADDSIFQNLNTEQDWIRYKIKLKKIIEIL